MAFGSFENGGSSQPMAEINTTPLVDVMLVLLVIFIITAPLFHEAVPIDLPQVDATRLDDPPQIVSVAIDAAGEVFVDGLAIARSDLAGRLAAIGAAGGKPELHLRADRGTRYERVTEVLADAQRAGLVRIAFVTEPAR
ncbi:MAG: biopolymer transporter ExbD [Candidatus Accumulibacter sp.]|uniref:ExbD/TolR family protein n=1 Tax=Accumulibacter sp. TaxID=2053492 RepID=UPI0019D9C8C1|nr:biopolymer transporter ExbD [Accumulibacter sp.]MBE2257674.1 biopolymer transporter ExbD [Paracoccaceae bacterium]MCP5247995.1 biopolymer transporter ExbD [Accumulibacter sp.]